MSDINLLINDVYTSKMADRVTLKPSVTQKAGEASHTVSALNELVNQIKTASESEFHSNKVAQLKQDIATSQYAIDIDALCEQLWLEE